jgi:hypothetical protein
MEELVKIDCCSLAHKSMEEMGLFTFYWQQTKKEKAKDLQKEAREERQEDGGRKKLVQFGSESCNLEDLQRKSNYRRVGSKLSNPSGKERQKSCR